MSDTAKVKRSMLYWVEPPEIGQPIEELDWVWIDTYSNGKMIIRDEKPSQEEVEKLLVELKPLYECCKLMQQELDELGYTFDYGLEGLPHNLREGHSQSPSVKAPGMG